MGPVYINDKAVVDLVPYRARHVARRLDVGPFSLLYLAVYLGTCQFDVKDGWGKAVVLVALPALLVCHLLVFLSTQWSVRFMCLVSQRRVASIDQAEVGYRHLRFVYDACWRTGWCAWCAGRVSYMGAGTTGQMVEHVSYHPCSLVHAICCP